jgi:transposase
MSKDSRLTLVKQQLVETPNVKAATVAKHLGISQEYAYNLMSNARKSLGMLKQRDGTWRLKTRMQSNRPEGMTAAQEKEIVTDVAQEIAKLDSVNHPAHYKTGGMETIEFIEAKGFGYNLGNVIKYLSRADYKGNREEDLLKARWYLNREIAKFTK